MNRFHVILSWQLYSEGINVPLWAFVGLLSGLGSHPMNMRTDLEEQRFEKYVILLHVQSLGFPWQCIKYGLGTIYWIFKFLRAGLLRIASEDLSEDFTICSLIHHVYRTKQISWKLLQWWTIMKHDKVQNSMLHRGHYNSPKEFSLVDF